MPTDQSGGTTHGVRTLQVGRLALSVLLLPFASAGCLHEPGGDLDADYAATPDPQPAPVVQREVTLVYDGDGDPAPVAALPASPRDRPPPDPVPFRIGAGHGALGHVDLGPCRELGLPAGYVRMHVSFRRDGHVSHATVESPTPPPQEALDCVGEQLEGALVPRFDGRDATLSKSLFVEPGSPDDELQPGDTVVRKDRPARQHKTSSTSAPLTVLTRP